MGNFITLTEKIRNQILCCYEMAKQEFEKNNQENDYIEENDCYEEINDDNPIDFENFEICIEELFSEESEEYETQIFNKVLKYINESKYKNVTYLIMMQDVWEYLKVKQIANIELIDYEEGMLEFLENNDIKDIFNKIKFSKEFSIDLFVLFIEYHYTHEIENRMVNRKLIELANKEKSYDKFKIKILDDTEYQYKKTRKLY